MPLKLTRPGTAAPAKKLGAKKLGAAPAKKLASRRPVDDDDDDQPARKPLGKKSVAKKAGAKPRGKATGLNRKGWAGGDELETGDYVRNLKPKDGGEYVLKFRETEPYVNTLIHWVDREQGRRSFPCLGADNECPLCAIGDQPRAEHRFNVILLTDGDPVQYSYTAPKSIYTKIKAFATAERTKPLTKRWYLLTREGSTKNNTRYDLKDYRRAEDIAEDFPDLYVPTADEIADIEVYTDEDFEKEVATFEDMEEVAIEIAGE